MEKNSLIVLTKTLRYVFLFCAISSVLGQETHQKHQKSNFWRHVQFGGGFGIAAGSSFTDITIAPNAIYNINDYLALGTGIQGSYISAKDTFNSTLYGASILALCNPVAQLQVSVELEEVRVNTVFEQTETVTKKNNFWNTALFLGGGFRSGNATFGARYNVLYNKNNLVYSAALMPFFRVYF